MKFLVYGKGWISDQVVAHLNLKGYEYQMGNARLDNVSDVEKELIESKATHVLCIVGRTHGVIDGKEYPTIDYLEQPGKLVENIRDNLFSQVNLAILTTKLGQHLHLVSTGCIFQYDDTHTTEVGFLENDLPNFFNSSYSIVKGFTDRLMHLFPVASSRIRMPISHDRNSRNFIVKITNYEKICSIENSMTVLDDLIPIYVDLSVKKFIGTINLTNPGVISHNKILEMYKEIVDPNFVWKNFSYEEQIKILAAGRSNNYLDTSLIQSLYPDVPHIKDGVRNVLLRMRDNEI